jgi:hypothetical protein
MSRGWTHIAGIPIDAIGFGLLFLLCLAGALLIGAAWHFWPRWLPRRSWFAGFGRMWRALRAFRLSSWWRARRRRHGERKRRWGQTPVKPAAAVPVAADQLPDVPAEQLLSLADQFAAAGQYREAVRERLRAITRQLVDRGYIPNHPEWTITELTRAAGAKAPVLQHDLDEASRIFSDIWYGERDATRAHDDRMRMLAAQIDNGAARGGAGSRSPMTPVTAAGAAA